MKNLHYKKHQLKNNLAQYVKYVWVMKGYEAKSKPDLLIADGYPEIIFVKNGAYSKTFLDPSKKPSIINSSCVIGIQTQSVLARRLEHCHLIGVKLNPLGANILFGDQLKNIVDANVTLDDFGVEWLIDLNTEIQVWEKESHIIDLLSKMLIERFTLSENSTANQQAASFLSAILSVDGQITVQQLANQHHLSIRHFQRKFKNFFGVSPKKFINIIRFKHLYKSSILKHQLPKDFLAFGYYDQMHFIKDFKRRLGVNPSKSAAFAFQQLNQIAKLSSQ